MYQKNAGLDYNSRWGGMEKRSHSTPTLEAELIRFADGLHGNMRETITEWINFKKKKRKRKIKATNIINTIS